MDLFRESIALADGAVVTVGDRVRVNTFAGWQDGTITAIYAYGQTPISVEINRMVSDFSVDDVARHG